MRRDGGGAAGQTHGRALRLGLTSEDDQHSKPTVEGYLAVQSETFEDEIGIGLLRQNRGSVPGRPDELADLLATAAAALDRLEGNIEPEPQLAIAFAVEFEAAPFEEDGHVLGLLKLDQEDPGTNGMQHAGWDVDDITGPHLDTVKQAEQGIDVLAHHQRPEFVRGDVSLEPEVTSPPSTIYQASALPWDLPRCRAAKPASG